jgi:hypothetical protein
VRFLITGAAGLLDSGWSERLHETRLRTWAEAPGAAIMEGER